MSHASVKSKYIVLYTAKKGNKCHMTSNQDKNTIHSLEVIKCHMPLLTQDI